MYVYIYREREQIFSYRINTSRIIHTRVDFASWEYPPLFFSHNSYAGWSESQDWPILTNSRYLCVWYGVMSLSVSYISFLNSWYLCPDKFIKCCLLTFQFLYLPMIILYVQIWRMLGGPLLEVVMKANKIYFLF